MTRFARYSDPGGSPSPTQPDLPPVPAAEEFQRIWQAAVNAVINEGADPTQALTQADQEAQDAIDSAQ